MALRWGSPPRLRLPLSEAPGAAFRDWVGSAAGPANGQYQYLTAKNQPPHGATLPVGGFVILDRQDTPVAAGLDPVPPDAAI